MARDGALEPLAGLARDRLKSWVVGQLQGRHRLHRSHVGRAFGATDDHVARQQHAEVRLDLRAARRELGVAGTPDQVRLDLLPELCPQRGLHVDLAQHAEPLLLQLVLDPLNHLREGLLELRPIA